ncbi:MAG: hypothetical protein ABIO70_08005 [Pseudomonadota bacterium]
MPPLLPTLPPCTRDGLCTTGLIELAAKYPYEWPRLLASGVPGRIRLGPTTTLREVGRAGAWPTLLAQGQQDPRRVVRQRRCFNRLVEAVGDVPVLQIDEREIARIRRALGTGARGAKRDAGVVRSEIKQLRLVVFELQVAATNRPRIGLDEPRRPPKVIMSPDGRFLERLITACGSLEVLAVLCVAVTGATEAQALRCRREQLRAQGHRMWVPGRTTTKGRRIPSRYIHLRTWAHPIVTAWVERCVARGLGGTGPLFPSRGDPTQPTGGLADLLDAACRRAGLSEIRWKSYGRCIGDPHPMVVQRALEQALAQAAVPTKKKR